MKRALKDPLLVIVGLGLIIATVLALRNLATRIHPNAVGTNGPPAVTTSPGNSR